MTHPMQMNCGHREDSICLDCATEYYTTHVIPLEQQAVMADSCLDLIKETIEQFGESTEGTPPMCYSDAIASLCSKRNREILVLRKTLEKIESSSLISKDKIDLFINQSKTEVIDEANG